MAKKKKANIPRRKYSAPPPRRKAQNITLALPALPGWLENVGPLALALVVLVAALLRGLYFRTDQLDVGIAVLVIAAFALLLRRTRASDAWELSYADLAVLGFVVFSWLSLLWAVEVRLALQQAIVYTMAGTLYLYARSRGEGGLAQSLLWGMGLIAVASWLMAGSVWNYPASVTVVDRLSGPFQYPDTAGAVFLATWLGAAAAQALSARHAPRLLWGALGGLSAYLFALTLSRGAWVVAPFAIVALLGVLPRGRRIGTLADLIVIGLAAFALAGKTFPHLDNAGSHYALLFGFLAAVLGGAVAEGIEWVHLRRLDSWRVALGALVIVLVLGGGALAYRGRAGVALSGQTTVALSLPPGRDELSLQISGRGSDSAQIVSIDRFGTQTTVAKRSLGPGSTAWTVDVPASSTTARLLTQGKGALRLEAASVGGKAQSLLLARLIPQSIYHRVINISGSDLSVWERIDFWRDGMKMFSHSPLVGFGGNAWQAIYQGYQSFAYSSNQAHSSFVDAAVSYGVFGIAFILLIAAALLFALRKAWGRGDWAGIALVLGATVFMHGLIDFDLSLAAVLFMVWVAIGAMPHVRTLTVRRPGAGLAQIAGGLSGALAVWMIFLAVAAGVEMAQNPPTIVQLRQAVSMDPLSSELHYRLAQEELKQAGSAPASSALRAAGAKDAATAYRLDPHNQLLATLEAQMEIDQGNDQGALATLLVAQQDQPMNPTMYQNYLDLATGLATHDLGQHKVSSAKRVLRQAWAMYERFGAAAAATGKVAPQNLQLPAATPQLELYAGEAAALLEKTHQATVLLKAASAGGQSATADLWLSALGQGNGKLAPSQYASQTQWLHELHAN